MTITSQLPDGSAVEWSLIDVENGSDICRYPEKVAQGKVVAHLPARYARRVHAGTIQANLDKA